VWQLPHFLALAVLYRDDYARAGFPMLPLTETSGDMTARQTVLYGLALIPISLFPTLLGLAGRSYFWGAAALSLLFFAAAARAAWRRSPQTARQLFRASVVYLPILLVWLAIDRVPR
jgi:protoheme IX farnesyltransferase